MFKVFIIALSIMLTTSCAITTVQPRDDVMKIRIMNNVDLPDKEGKPQLARTSITGNYCLIELRKYPVCLKHEIRHCFEGNWHEGRETTKDC